MKRVSDYIHEADLYLFDTGDAQRAYYTFGCHRIQPSCEGGAEPTSDDNGVYLFTVWAPHAKKVRLVGDFNEWNPEATPMEHVHNGVYACVASGLHDGSLYKFHIVGADGLVHLKADPFAFHAENGLSTASKVWVLDGYQWHDGAYMEKRAHRNPQNEAVSIYELHLGSWRVGENEVYPNYRTVADELVTYCKEMHYTHVELMPLTEYPLLDSWGYQTTGYYSICSRYGTPQDFMYLVDTLHENGIGVLMDWVPAHFPKDAFALARFDGAPLYEYADPRKGEHAEWGTLVFDYGKSQVVSFLVSAAMFLFDVYHIDGLRVDAVSSMLYLDYGRTEWMPNRDGGNINLEAVEFLQKLNSAVLSNYPGAIMVAEESTAYPMVTLPPYVGGLGFTFKWNMGFMHDTLDYVQTDPLWRGGNHYKLTFSMDYAYTEAFILEYSHDEVVYGKKSMVNKMFGTYEQKFATLRTLMGFQFAHPGKKLTFMGSEFAQFDEWDYHRQLQWELLDYPAHEKMQRFSAELNAFYHDHACMWKDDMEPDGFYWCNRDSGNENSVGFLRTCSDGSSPDVVCCCNFSPEPARNFYLGLPSSGKLKKVFSSDESRFGGSGTPVLTYTTEKEDLGEFPFSARVDLPPLSCIYFEYEHGRHEQGKEVPA